METTAFLSGFVIVLSELSLYQYLITESHRTDKLQGHMFHHAPFGKWTL